MISFPAPTRAPGIRFETQPPPLAEHLPRMDVAAFFGFAACGPIDVPVAVEDFQRFEEVFGSEFSLAWNQSRDEPVVALLAPTVRAFFENGGRRCWVIRVAGTAVSRQFQVSSEDAGSSPAVLQARSPGSWADDLVVTLRLQCEALPILRNSNNSRLSPGVNVAMGDCVCFTAGDQHWLATPATAGREIFGWTWNIRPDSSAQPADPNKTLDAQAITGVTRLTFTLEVRDTANRVWTLSHLGLLATHARWWRSIPDDRLWFDTTSPAHRERQITWRDCDQPRFPLAGFPSVSSSDPWNPWGDLAWLDGKFLRKKAISLTSIPDTGSPLERDGLHQFSPSLFIPPQAGVLLRSSSSRLIEEWTARQSLSNSTASPSGGLFRLLALEEVTLVAVPDAVHLGWARGKSRSDTALTPTPPVPPVDDSATADFAQCVPPGPTPPTAPLLTARHSADFQHWLLEWSAVPGANYSVEWSHTADFREITTSINQNQISHVPTLDQGESRFYRVRPTRGPVPQSSSAVVQIVRPTIPVEWIETEPSTYQPPALVALQRVLLRLCAARGDVLASLSFPRHYQALDVQEHIARLAGPESLTLTWPTAGTGQPASPPSSTVPGLETERDATLAVGAAYHPWLRQSVPGPAGERTIPPEGPALGLMARRAVTRGAWVAPANEPPRGIRGLDPWASSAELSSLRSHEVNLWTPDRGGARLWSAKTLNSHEPHRQINVRRLLQLLRRLLRREGNVHAFEPNNALLRRTIERSLGIMLDELFRRGAFAGAEPASSYQLAVQEPGAGERGSPADSLVVELQVAPSRPLEFLTIRLAQVGEVSRLTESR